MPESILPEMKAEYQNLPPDTDWFIDELYSFAPDLGITLISARYSRYVIDLNRDPESKPLYHDGRTVTELVPTKTFDGDAIYLGRVPNADEIKERKKIYYDPYYEKIELVLQDLKSEFGKVLFFDAHSIRRVVPSIRKEPFPDLILGDQNGKTASSLYSDTALRALRESKFEVSYNDPFRGGNLTRHFGRPEEGIHALQLEMCQDLYMDERQAEYREGRSLAVEKVLAKNLFFSLKSS